MTNVTFEVFYLGTMSDLDPDESDFTTDNAEDLVGQVYGSQQAPLWKEVSQLTAEDANDDGYIDTNDDTLTAENLTFDGVTTTLDSVTEYGVTITYTDGTTATTLMNLLQDSDGRVFLAPFYAGASENDVLDDQPIASISLDYVEWAEAQDIFTETETDAFIVCYSAGSLIETSRGPVDVARLALGDRVRTQDNGLQPIRWIGARRVRATGRAAPVRIAAGALGTGLPRRDLRVSQQHRILIRSPIARRIFGVSEVLIAAKKLVDLPGIDIVESPARITYWHFLLDAHEIVFAEGAASESLFTGPQAMQALGETARAQIEHLLPRLSQAGQHAPPARQIAQGRARGALLKRHLKNDKPVYQAG